MFFLKALVPYTVLLQASFFLVCAILLVLVFIIFYLLYYLNRLAKRRQLIEVYSEFISEIIICEGEEELVNVLNGEVNQKLIKACLSAHLGKTVLMEQLTRSHKNISGQGADNIRWVFEQLSLQETASGNLNSLQWHVKATAIQQLSEMGQIKYLTKIYKATNSKNALVRKEAQVALVKMTGFNGLRFLNVISYPLSQWQQLCLLRELPMGENCDVEKIKSWLQSANETVVEFALRLIKKFALTEQHDLVAGFLVHPSEKVRLQAIETLQEIATEQTPMALQQVFGGSPRQEKLMILSVLSEIGSQEQVAFFRSLLLQPDAFVRVGAEKALVRMGENFYRPFPAEQSKLDVV